MSGRPLFAGGCTVVERSNKQAGHARHEPSIVKHMKPLRILLQTTIPTTEDDWSIARFSLLTSLLTNARLTNGRPAFEVLARDRATIGFPDPFLVNLSRIAFDELWLFGVDPGDGLMDEDCDGIARFQQRGGGVLVTRDHMDLGSSVRMLPELGAAHYFHSWNNDPDDARCRRDDTGTPEISWPNYHSGANGDFQTIEVVGDPHPVLISPDSATGCVRYLPSHPHEGSVGHPPSNARARLIARGISAQTGAPFNIAVAFEGNAVAGPALAQSTFHHFVDLNWNPALGAPSFVTEPSGHGLLQSQEAQRDLRRFVLNVAFWLGGRHPSMAADIQ